LSIAEEILEYLRCHYPHDENRVIAEKLGLSEHMVRRKASKLGIRKSKEFLEKKMQLTRQGQKDYFEKKRRPLNPTVEQLSIILGSLLGDATLSRGPRSKHFAYKEHFSEKQREYRIWKQQKLSNLGFHITQRNHLYSYAHPLFTDLHGHFFKHGRKTVPASLFSQMTHPLFLACLYMDDGSLILSTRQTPSTIYIHPSIVIYSQSFTKEENEQLKNHLNETFQTNFVLTSRPDGHGFILKLNKEREVQHFLKMIQPYMSSLPSMRYKTSLEERMRKEEAKYTESGKHVVLSSSENKKQYTEQEIKRLLRLHSFGLTWSEIAVELNRTYWSVVYKAREMGLVGSKKHPDR
jgi:hypothetical protein